MTRPHERTGLRCRPEYRVWAEMIQRCHNPNDASYRLYGGRGIAVCDAWRASFLAFFRDMGPRPEGRSAGGRALFSVERVDNDLGYDPDNCAWATTKTQAQNRRASGRTAAYVGRVNGLDVTVAQLADLTGLTKQAVRYRLLSMSAEQVAALPRDARGRPRAAA